MSFLKKIKAKSNSLFFEDVLGITKNILPQLKLQFPTPPTYIWNPENKDDKIDIQGIKDKLKVKLPNLSWTTRYEGVPVADYVFLDGTWAEFAIGKEANHFTLTYNKDKQKLGSGN